MEALNALEIYFNIFLSFFFKPVSENLERKFLKKKFQRREFYLRVCTEEIKGIISDRYTNIQMKSIFYNKIQQNELKEEILILSLPFLHKRFIYTTKDLLKIENDSPKKMMSEN